MHKFVIRLARASCLKKKSGKSDTIYSVFEAGVGKGDISHQAKKGETLGSFRVRSTNFLLNLRDPTPISMKFGTLADNA